MHLNISLAESLIPAPLGGFELSFLWLHASFSAFYSCNTRVQKECAVHRFVCKSVCAVCKTDTSGRVPITNCALWFDIVKRNNRVCQWDNGNGKCLSVYSSHVACTVVPFLRS